MIGALQAELAQHRDLIARLRGEIGALRGPSAAADPKFKRVKQEFSRRFHPDGLPRGDAERARRERVFQEFWPIVEDIERS